MGGGGRGGGGRGEKQNKPKRILRKTKLFGTSGEKTYYEGGSRVQAGKRENRKKRGKDGESIKKRKDSSGRGVHVFYARSKPKDCRERTGARGDRKGKKERKYGGKRP